MLRIWQQLLRQRRGTPLWLIIFSDLSTNLMLFFLILFAMTRMSAAERQMVIEGLESAVTDKVVKHERLLQKQREREAVRILRRDGRYKRAAYDFVLEGIRRAADSGHVTAEELLDQIREMALEKFGPLARTVFTDWHVTTTEDFGNVVFSLVDEEAIGKTEEDELSHFIDVFEFEEAFPDHAVGEVAIRREDAEEDEED